MISPTMMRTVKVKGVTTHGIIYNGNYYFTDIEVYSDGLINCWDMVDLKQFKNKLKTDWVVVEISNHQRLYIHHVGYVEITEGNWKYNKRSYNKYITSIVKSLNPRMENIFNCHNRDIEIRNGIRYTWPPRGEPKPLWIDTSDHVFPKEVCGDSRYAICKYENVNYLVSVHLFENDIVRIVGLPHDKEMTFNELLGSFENGSFFTIPKQGEKFVVSEIGEFVVGEDSRFIDLNDVKLELQDEYNRIQGKHSIVTICAKAFEEYENNPNSENLEKLRVSYEVIPQHLRCYCGDMDRRDTMIRRALYGDECVE